MLLAPATCDGIDEKELGMLPLPVVSLSDSSCTSAQDHSPRVDGEKPWQALPKIDPTVAVAQALLVKPDDQHAPGGLVAAIRSLMLSSDSDLKVACVSVDANGIYQKYKTDIESGEREPSPSMTCEAVGYTPTPRALADQYLLHANAGPGGWFSFHGMPEYCGVKFSECDKSASSVADGVARLAVEQALKSKSSVVFVQDYQITEVPRLARQMLERSGENDHPIAFFLHIPWAEPSVYRYIEKMTSDPQLSREHEKSVLQKMLNSDSLVFLDQSDADHFIARSEKLGLAKVVWDAPSGDVKCYKPMVTASGEAKHLHLMPVLNEDPGYLNQYRSIHRREPRGLPWYGEPLRYTFKEDLGKKVQDMMGSDLIGFHTTLSTELFIKTLKELREEGAVCFDRIAFHPGTGKGMVIGYVDPDTGRDRNVMLGTYPIGVSVEAIQSRVKAIHEALPESPFFKERQATETLLQNASYLGKPIVVLTNRCDPTKFLPDTQGIIELMYDRHPQLKGKVGVVNIAQDSRGDLPIYAEEQRKNSEMTTRVNQKHGGLEHDPDWKPILTVPGLPQPQVFSLYSRPELTVILVYTRDGFQLATSEAVAAAGPRGNFLPIISDMAGSGLTYQGHGIELIPGPNPKRDPGAIRAEHERIADLVADALVKRIDGKLDVAVNPNMAKLQEMVSLLDVHTWMRQQVADARAAKALAGVDLRGDDQRLTLAKLQFDTVLGAERT